MGRKRDRQETRGAAHRYGVLSRSPWLGITYMSNESEGNGTTINHHPQALVGARGVSFLRLLPVVYWPLRIGRSSLLSFALRVRPFCAPRAYIYIFLRVGEVSLRGGHFTTGHLRT